MEVSTCVCLCKIMICFGKPGPLHCLYLGLQAVLCQHHAQRSLELTAALGCAKEEREYDYDRVSTMGKNSSFVRDFMIFERQLLS